MINFPQRFRITDLLPGFSIYANILDSFPVDNDNWTNEMARVTLFINQHDYAFHAMVTLGRIVIWNNQPDREAYA